MDDMLILGVDLSLNSTGLCIINKSKNIVHAESVNPYPLDSIERLYYIHNRIFTVLTSYDISIVGYETQLQQQRFQYSAGSILPLAEEQGVFKLALHKYRLYKDVKVYGFKPQVLKESLSGNPKADKELMMESLGLRKLKHLKDNVIETSVNDCCDAYAAALSALKVNEGTFNLEFKEFK